MAERPCRRLVYSLTLRRWDLPLQLVGGTLCPVFLYFYRSTVTALPLQIPGRGSQYSCVRRHLFVVDTGRDVILDRTPWVDSGTVKVCSLDSKWVYFCI